MTHKNDVLRKKILRIIEGHEAIGSPSLISASQIGEKLHLTTREVDYHLDILQREGYVDLAKAGPGNHAARLTIDGKRFLREGRMPGPSHPSTSIGAVIGNVEGPVQAIGTAYKSDFSQIISDPKMRDEYLENLERKIIETIRDELPKEDLNRYMDTLKALHQEMMSSQPKGSRIRTLLSAISLLGDIDGSISLIGRVLPFVMTLVSLARGIIAK
jgi:DNA-binding transcriptional ArsR family regulator